MNNIIQPNVLTDYIIRYCESRIVRLIYIIDLFFYGLNFLVQGRATSICLSLYSYWYASLRVNEHAREEGGKLNIHCWLII